MGNYKMDGNKIKGSLNFDEKRNKFFFRFYYTDRVGNKKRRCVTGNSEDECQEAAKAFLKKECLPAEKSEITIPDILLDEYDMRFKLNKNSENTMLRKLYTINIIEAGGLKDIPIIDITQQDLYKFMVWLTRYSQSNIEKTYGAIKMAFNKAADKGIVDRNAFDSFGIIKPNSSKSNKTIYAFDVDERNKFLEALENYNPPKNRNNYKNQLALEFYTGMRMGEINALTPKDVDFAGKRIHVNKTITRDLHHNTKVGKKTKTKTGVRDIPVDDLVLDILKDAIDKMGNNPDNLIFYDYNQCAPVSTQNVNATFRRICEKAGLPCYGQHMLRHTFATYTIESGASVYVLSKWLGHKDIQVTINTYIDVLNQFQDQSFQIMEDYKKKTLCTYK